MTETLTLTKALVELKLLSKRIDKRVNSLDPVTVKRGKQNGGKFEASVKSQAEFERDTKAAWQALGDLMRRRRKIKTALVLANASTSLTVAGETMTIAEAIERKGMLDIEQLIVRKIRAKLYAAQGKVDAHNREMEGKLLKLLETTYAKKDAQLSKEDYERISKPFYESNEMHLVDPLNCEKTVQKMEDAYEKFLAEVDVCLSIANATTEITI